MGQGDSGVSDYCDQSMNVRPGTCLKSRAFRVTNVAPASRTIAAIRRSILRTVSLSMRRESYRLIDATSKVKIGKAANEAAVCAKSLYAHTSLSICFACRRYEYQPESCSSTLNTVMAKSSRAWRETFVATAALPSWKSVRMSVSSTKRFIEYHRLSQFDPDNQPSPFSTPQ